MPGGSWPRLGQRQVEREFGGRALLQLRLEMIEQVAEKIFEMRTDLPRGFADDRDAFWRWLNVFGIRDFRLLRDLLVPVPPPDVRQFTGSSDEIGYFLTGANSYEIVFGLWRAHRSGAPLPRVYDFGCGPGRTLRWFLRHAGSPEASFVGTDVDVRAIEWAAEHFPFGEFRVNSDVPPLDFDDASFDLIYAISVFSHLEEENHLAWLRELRRVVSSRGLLVLTTLGREALRLARENEDVFRLASVPLEELERGQRQLDTRGFAFIRQPGGHLNTEVYGVAYIDPKYIASRWSEQFKVVSIKPAGLDSLQDVIVLEPQS